MKEELVYPNQVSVCKERTAGEEMWREEERDGGGRASVVTWERNEGK